MKKTIYIMMALLLATNAYAQVVDQDKLQKFIAELKALNGEHVTCVNENSGSNTYLEYPSDFLVLEVNGQNMSVTGLETSDTTFRYVSVMSEDNIGYNLINGVFEKYYDEESEDIFGIPLMACQREDGEQESIFVCEGHTLLVRDSGDDVMILYATMNIMERVQDAMRSVMEMTTEDFVDVDMFGGMDFGVHTNMDALSKHPDNPYCPSADGESIMALVRKIFNDNTELLESRLAKAESEEEREELIAEIAAFKEEAKESLDDLEKELAELDEPSFIKIVPGSDERYVAIPRVPAHLKEKVKPYAAKGVYDWINMYYSFRAGAKMGVTDVVSCIITPKDVARECIIRNYPRNKWYDDGFTPEYKELAAVEYQGCMPAVLYSFSQNENGYNEMLREYGDMFRRKLGEKVLGLKVTQCCENNGKRFVQLWGEGDVLMCLYDSPAEKYFHMSIIIGGVSGFEQAVNEYRFGGEKDFAKRCNIVIDSDLRNNSYGIHFVNDEYFYAGKSHKNGVHIDFGYARKLLR
jgi:hypothetical protein